MSSNSKPLKAWVISHKECGYPRIVYAPTLGKAKAEVLYDFFNHFDAKPCFINLVGRRLKQADQYISLKNSQKWNTTSKTLKPYMELTKSIYKKVGVPLKLV